MQQIGIQAHCVRAAMAADFAGTLRRLADMGFGRIELCSFPGCAGNPWGDFGSLADETPEKIRATVEDAGLDCIATHVMPHELLPDQIDTTIRWVQAVGAPVVVLAGLRDLDVSDPDAWRLAGLGLNELGARMADHGLGFAYHTQNDAWRPVKGTLPMKVVLDTIDPARCAIELDPSGALVTGADWRAVVRAYPGRFFAMHLRDGIRPDRDVPYLPAVPLGAGDEDWPSALETAAQAGISRYLLEMEVLPDQDVFEALRASLLHLDQIGVLQRGDSRNAA